VHLPENLRNRLKEPLGILIRNDELTKESISKHLLPDSFVISVGDATTEKLIGFNLIPSIQIVDGLEKRKKRALPPSNVSTNLTCRNPPAEITQQSLETIKKAFQSPKPVRITVVGEEDLLVLPICILASDTSVIMYGQPNEGLVIVKVSKGVKNKAQSIINSMS